MKIGIVSDTHGFFKSWKKAFDMYLNDTELIIHAGDILYCSPGYNEITEEFDPTSLADHINGIDKPIVFCRGDNDADVDQKRLNFPIQSLFSHLYIDNISIIVHHGENENWNTNFKNRLTPNEMHKYAKKMKADIYVLGRTHKPVLEIKDNILHINPGSPVLTVHDNEEPTVGLLDTVKRTVAIMSTVEKGKILNTINF